jgi:hypothetical protein
MMEEKKKKIPEKAAGKRPKSRRTTRRKTKPQAEVVDLVRDADMKTDAHLVPYDENLLERSRTQWHFGDWESLVQLRRDTLQHHPDRAKLALLAAAGHLQTESYDHARQYIRLAMDWGCSKQLISRVMVSGVHNILGRAAAIAGKQDRTLDHFEKAISIAFPDGDTRLLTRARIMKQLEQIRLPEFYPTNPLLSWAEPNRSKTNQHDLSRTLSAQDTPGGDKYKILAQIHRAIKPRFYLEIGVHQGKSLALATCEAIGIDPVPRERATLGKNARVVTATSDDFFACMADSRLKTSPDLVLIDGMHLLEYALRDFNNIERRANTSTLVIVSDIYPTYPEQATRRRQGPDWIGDVWKLPRVLADYRPDLFTLGLDAADNGMLLITCLDRNNTILEEKTADIIAGQAAVDLPPNDVMEKDNALRNNHPAFSALLATIRQARERSLGQKELANLIAEWS